MLSTVTHVAGPVVQICGRTLQRCPICGLKLVDSADLENAIGLATMRRPEAGTWPEASFVQMDGARTSVMGTFEDALVPLPRDLCLELVER